jgi:hypothetical protein
MNFRANSENPLKRVKELQCRGFESVRTWAISPEINFGAVVAIDRKNDCRMTGLNFDRCTPASRKIGQIAWKERGFDRG